MTCISTLVPRDLVDSTNKLGMLVSIHIQDNAIVRVWLGSDGSMLEVKATSGRHDVQVVIVEPADDRQCRVCSFGLFGST